MWRRKKEFVRACWEFGLSLGEIANILQVSRQRISQLLGQDIDDKDKTEVAKRMNGRCESCSERVDECESCISRVDGSKDGISDSLIGTCKKCFYENVKGKIKDKKTRIEGRRALELQILGSRIAESVGYYRPLPISRLVEPFGRSKEETPAVGKKTKTDKETRK